MQACRLAPRYEIELTTDAGSARVTGSQRIAYTNSERDPLADIVLRLLPNAPGYGRTMTVTHLLVSGQSIPYESEMDDSVLRAPLDPRLEPDRMLRFSMDFAVDVPTSDITGHGLFSYIRGVMALPIVYPLIPSHDARGWHVETTPVYGDDLFSHVALYRVKIADPSPLTLIATGACEGLAEGTWVCDAAPLRDFTIILGENYERAGREVRNVVLNNYFYHWHRSGGEKTLDVASDAL